MNTLIEYAKKMVGKPYKWGGKSPEGFDCTGLISYCYTLVGLPMFHHTVIDLLNYCEVVDRLPELGDLVFRKYYSTKVGKVIVDHVGIVVEPGMVVSAWRKRGVVLEPLNSEFNIVAKLRPDYKLPSVPRNYLESQPTYSTVREVLE